MAPRNTYLIARISPEKKEEYERLAKSEGVSLGALIRFLLDEFARKKSIPIESWIKDRSLRKGELPNERVG